MLIPKFSVSGGDAVAYAIKKLGNKVGKKPIRKGLRAGAKVFQMEMKRAAPVRSGFLRKHIKVRSAKPKRDRLQVLATSGDPKKANLNSGDAWYGGAVEYGHAGGGWYRGKVDAKPYIRPSFDAKKQQAEKTAQDTIRAEVRKLK